MQRGFSPEIAQDSPRHRILPSTSRGMGLGHTKHGALAHPYGLYSVSTLPTGKQVYRCGLENLMLC